MHRHVSHAPGVVPPASKSARHCISAGSPSAASIISAELPDRYFNHCCDPNVYLRFAADRIDVVARRDVDAGAELTLDYLINNPGGDSWPCHCRAERCRGETSHSFFTLPPEVQREYLPLLAPWFQKRYARELEGLTRSPSR